jgi:cyanophycin synthetase
MGDKQTSISSAPSGAEEIELVGIEVYEGPNLWYASPVVVACIDVSAAEPDGAERLLRLMGQAGLDSAVADESSRQSLIDIGSIIQGIALEMQRFAGDELSFSASMRGQEPGHFNVAVECKQAELARAAIALTVRMLNAMLFATEPDFDIQRELDDVLAATVQRRSIRPMEDAIIAAARRQKIPVRFRTSPLMLLELGTGRYLRRYRSMTTSRTSHVALTLSNNKSETTRLLKEAGLPVPRGMVVTSVETAIAAAEKIGYPVVLKPVHGGQGRGLAVDLRSPEQIAASFEAAATATSRRSVIVEEFLPGAEHRILVIDGKVAAVSERIPAHVVGDGKRTIEQLIALTNADPLRGHRHTRILTRITPDDETRETLARAGMTLQSVPNEGAYVPLKRVSNLSQGGTARDRTDEIHPENARVAGLAARVIGFDVCGLDMITPDLTRPIWEVGGAIIEVNGEPGPRLHLHPQDGEVRDIGAVMVRYLFPEGQPSRIPLVAVLGRTEAAEVADVIATILHRTGRQVGLTTTRRNVVCGNAMSRSDLPGRSHPDLVLRNPDVEWGVIQVTPEDFEAPGLAFEYCDVVVLCEMPARSSAWRSPADALLDLMGTDGIAIINGAIPESSMPAPFPRERSVLYGVRDGDERIAEWLESGGTVVATDSGSALAFDAGGRRTVAELPATNASAGGIWTAAIASAIALGIPEEDVRAALAELDR